ncbi:MAG: FG-GAP repeat domain-containing protein, partial [Candidatus Limnocylindria bacterium]
MAAIGGDTGDMNQDGAVIALDRHGNQLWRFASLDWFPEDGYGDGIFSTPALCDVDGNGDAEIAFGGWDQRIYLLDHHGASLWNNLPNGFPGPGFHNGDTVWSSPACADFNGDGQQEIVIGADIADGGILPDGTQPADGGFLYVFDQHGTILVRRHFPETIYSSPAIGDLDGNGRLEIVVGTGWYHWNQHGRDAPSFVYAFDSGQLFSSRAYADPAKLPDLPGWPQQTNFPGFSSPALADLEGDGDLEIVIGTGQPFLQGADHITGDGSVYAWHHSGQLVQGWPVHPRDSYQADGPIWSSPTVADVDADGQVEVLFAMLWDVQVYNANGAFQEVLHTTWTVAASPAVGDSDGDGKVDVWIGSSHTDQNPAQGYLWHFEQGSPGIGAQPWPQFHRDPSHSGRFGSALSLNVGQVVLY